MKRPILNDQDNQPSTKRRVLPSADTVQRVMDLVHQHDLDHADLYTLLSQIGKLYSTKANAIVQQFPQDLWNLIFQHPDLQETPFSDWLCYRTVCRLWNKSILSMQEFRIPPRYLPQRVLKLFSKLTAIDLREDMSIGLDLLSGIRTLCLHGTAFGIKRLGIHQLETLTNLTSLSLKDHPKVDSDVLVPLTNLTYLSLNCQTVTSIRALTNLTSLNLVSAKLPWRETVLLRAKLTSVTTNQNGYFLSGQGTYHDPINGITYTGQWANGLFHGEGVFTAKNITYSGGFAKGQFDGQGVYAAASGERYEGSMKDGKRHGHGFALLKKRDGDEIYEGDWVADRRVGKGKSQYFNGEKYEGEIENGEPHGRGTYYYANGDIYRGYFEFGLRQGRGTLTRAGGRQVRGYWETNELIDEDDKL